MDAGHQGMCVKTHPAFGRWEHGNACLSPTILLVLPSPSQVKFLLHCQAFLELNSTYNIRIGVGNIVQRPSCGARTSHSPVKSTEGIFRDLDRCVISALG